MRYTLRLPPALNCTPCAVFYQHAGGMEEGSGGLFGAGVGEGGGRPVGRQERPELKYAETLQVSGETCSAGTIIARAWWLGLLPPVCGSETVCSAPSFRQCTRRQPCPTEACLSDL